MKFAPLILCVWIPAVFLSRADDREPETVSTFSENPGKKLGLVVRPAILKVKPADKRRVELAVVISNFFRDEVFIEENGGFPMSFSISEKKESGNIVAYRENAGFGGLRAVFPNNLNRLKRLHHAKESADGKVTVCGCATMRFQFPIEFPEGTEDTFADWEGGTGTVKLEFIGFFRSNGRKFRAEIEIPFEVEPIP